MRTLKKTLCLVLCLAMMVGLCAMGASAAMTDEDQIQSKEAVAVLNALGVITGYEDGSFRPTNELNRAEGAAIMTRLLNGTATGTSTFTDMAGYEWAQPYVAYCESMGIIAGYGDGRFGPSDKLTVAQFAKMLLCALGYDAEREQLTGNAWEIGVAKLVNQTGLAKDVDNFNYSAPITRDAAAQMAFNTLKTTMVGYNGNGIAVAGGQLATPRENLQNATYDYRADREEPDGLMQFIENYFPKFKLHVAEDDFGVATNFWFNGANNADKTYAKNKLAAQVMNANVLATYTTTVARVTSGAIYTDAHLTEDANLAVSENGWDAEEIPAVKNGTTFPIAKYAGATVLLLDTTENGVGDKLVVQYPYLAKVTRVITAANSETKNRQAVLTVYNKEGGVTVNFDTEDYAVSDWILVYPKGTIAWTAAGTANEEAVWGKGGAEIIKDEKAEIVSGTLSKVGVRNNTVNSLTIGETAYSIGAADLAKLDVAGKATADFALNGTYDAYLSNGYVLGAASNAVAYADYVFVIGHANKQDALAGGSVELGYVKTDATTATAIVNNGVDETTNANAWYYMAPVGTKYNFNRAADEAYAEGDLAGNALSASKPTIADGIVANDNTTFVIRSGNARTFKSYTGIKNVPTFRASGNQATVYALMRYGFASVVYIDLSGRNSTDTSSSPIYVTGAYSAVRTSAGLSYYTYTVIKDGAKVTIESRIQDLPRGLIIPQISADNIITSYEEVPANSKYLVNVAPDVVLTYSAGTLKINGYAYSVGEDTKVYMYAPSGTLTVGTPADLGGMTAGYFSAITVSDANKKIVEIYAQNLTVTQQD